MLTEIPVSKFSTCRMMAFAILLNLCLVLPSIASSAGVEVGTLVFLQGGVHLKKPGNEILRSLRPGDIMYVGDILDTGKDGRAQLMLTDKSIVTLAPGSAVRVNQYSFNPVTRTRRVALRVMRGKVRVIQNPVLSRESWFMLMTDNVSNHCAEDLVVVVSEGDTKLIVLHGIMDVTNSSGLIVGTVTLKQKQVTVVRGNNPPSMPTYITEAQRREYSRDAKRF